jgi:catechol 2,3-dioxygenase-like lactoylglutathione lyase family enzyme
MPDIAGIHHISITVTDIERSVPWYCDLLGLEKLMEEQHPHDDGYAIVLGKPDWSMCIGLHTHPANEKERFSEARTGLDHVGFTVGSPAALEEWKKVLEQRGVDHSPINKREGYSVLVFRDPDNVQLEFFAFG